MCSSDLTHLGLEQAIAAALTRTVQKEDDRPTLIGRRVSGRNEDLVAIRLRPELRRAIEKAGLDALGRQDRRGEEHCGGK